MIRTTWKRPHPYGAPFATDSASTIAAPLLAGFSITLIAQVIGSRRLVWWPDLVFGLLAGAVICMLAAVQFGFWARQYFVRPDELETWWPDLDQPQRWANVRQDQWAHARVHEIWSARFRRAYRLGILLLLAGLGFALVPSAEGGDFGVPRMLAIAVVGAGLVGELLWIAASWVLHLEVRLKRAQERRAAEAMRDELSTRPDDPEAARQAAVLSARLAEQLADPVAQAREELAGKREHLTAELPWGVRQLVRGAMRTASAIVPPLLPVEPPRSVPPPSVQRDAAHKPVPAVTVARGRRQAEVLALVAQRPEIGAADVAREIGLPPGRVDKILVRLTELGGLQQVNVNGSVSYRCPGS